ncbi:hypothetical protein OENI_30065 [Oenococcus oeni]|nr:hypothetical protein OENI_30065 [Oenococcus oeni]
MPDSFHWTIAMPINETQIPAITPAASIVSSRFIKFISVSFLF